MRDEEAADTLQRNDDLVERLRAGDVWALPSLIEAVTGARVVEQRIIEDTRPR
jgi:hypothetical protein